MPDSGRPPLHTTAPTDHALRVSIVITLLTGTYLAWHYAALPDLLAVHFAWNGQVNGWQFKTVLRVLMPALVQLTLLLSLGAIAALLVWRPANVRGATSPETLAAAIAAEAVLLIATIWIAFQGYAAHALVTLWTAGQPTLGAGYTVLEVVGFALTALVGIRAHVKLGHPEPLPYVAAHWRLRHLYCNAADPALFVPARDGRRWTLNFGRPAAVVLLGGTLTAGVVLPLVILVLGLRS